jgi:hypothetical protein
MMEILWRVSGTERVNYGLLMVPYAKESSEPDICSTERSASQRELHQVEMYMKVLSLGVKCTASGR